MEQITQKVKRQNIMTAGFMISAFIGLFGETALNMALTNIMQQFSITTGTVQWLTTGFLLVLGILVPVSALLLQWFTTRQLAISAITFSMIGTIICGLAPNFTFLLVGRLLQAVGTGILLPLMMNVVLLIYPIEKRGSIMGIMGLVITLAPALGPTLSGLIVDFLSWHYIFWFSLVFYIILFILWVPLIQNVTTVTKPKVDIYSVAASSIGFGLFIYSLGVTAESSITKPNVYLPFIISVIAIFLFVKRQLNMAQPMIDLRVFSYKNFAIGTILLFIGFALILSSAILLPLYLKGVLLVSAVTAGLMMLPGNIINAILAPIVGRVFDRIGPRLLLIVGFSFTVIAGALFAFSTFTTPPAWIIIVAFMLLCLGLAMALMPAQTNGLNELPPSLYSHGAATMNTLQQVAGAAGTALAITLMNFGMRNYENKMSPAAIGAGSQFAFFIIFLLAIVAFIFALFVKRARYVKK